MCPQETKHHWKLFLDTSTVLVIPDSMQPSSRLLIVSCHMNKIIPYSSKSFTEDQIKNLFIVIQQPCLLTPEELDFHLFVCACTGLCTFASWVQVHEVARRGRQIPWSCSCRHLEVSQKECWEPNSGPLEEHEVLLITRNFSRPSGKLLNNY